MCRWSTCTLSAPAAARSPRSTGGMLRVGPESAGAEPGPICYGRGGTEPTITDANLVLGRLNPARFWRRPSGDARPCRALIEEKVGSRSASMPSRRRRHPAHRQRPHGRRHAPGVAVARPRSARLRAVRLRRGGSVACHGAGARAGVPTVLVPARPGITNALGCVVADLRHDFGVTVNRPLADIGGAAWRTQSWPGRSTPEGR